MVASLEHDDALARIGPVDLFTQHLDTPKISGENNHLFIRVLSPKPTKGGNQLFNFGLGLMGKLFQQSSNPLPLFRECRFDSRDRWEERLIDLVKKHAHRDDREILQIILEAVRSWTGSPELQDDMTLLLAREVSTL